MTLTFTLSPAARLAHLPAEYKLSRGCTLSGAVVGYEDFGRKDGPVVVVQGGISAVAHVAAHDGDPAPGWWDAHVAPGRSIDPRRYRVISCDWLGGAGASTGPATHGRPFPAVAPIDQARATAHVLASLGVERVHAWIGASYGALVGLELAALRAVAVERVVAVGAALRTDALSTAWRALQRRILALGCGSAQAVACVELARALAMTTYRGRDEWNARFADPPECDGFTARFPVEKYLSARGADWAESFDAESYRVLSQAIDLANVDAGAIDAAVTFVGARQDLLVPIELVRASAALLGARGRVEEFDSIHGHDAFLKEDAALERIFFRVLAEEAAR